MRPRVLVAGIGNIFLGDDAFGCEVIKQLLCTTYPANVKIIDFGIRGFDLVYALVDGYELVVLVDAVPQGEAPGTVYEIEPDLNCANEQPASLAIETHAMNPVRVLQLAKSMGANFEKLILVGCEPETFGPEEGQIGLSDVVESAVARGVQVVDRIVKEFLSHYEQLWEGNTDAREERFGNTV